MTVSDSIITWLKRFTAEGLERIRTIDTDALKATSASYGLIKDPQENIKHYMSGRELHTDYYQFSARLGSETNMDRADNQAWLEGLVEWVGERRQDRDFPVLRPGLKCVDISITSPFFMGRSDNNTAVYQLTIAIEYEKEK